MRDIAYIALGSNLGDRHAHLAAARAALATLPSSRVLASSPVEETEPVGGVPQGPFLNQMLALETELTPHELLAELQRIEGEAGRTRTVRWGPRTLDLDIVMYEAQQSRDPELMVPHPQLPHRVFWQRELAALRGAR